MSKLANCQNIQYLCNVFFMVLDFKVKKRESL